MPPPPIERRKSFWLGAFVLVFIGWASWQSFSAYRGFAWNLGSHAIGIVRMSGSTYFVEGPLGTPSGLTVEKLPHLPPPAMVHHWKKQGIRVARISDVAAAAFFIAIWVCCLAWLERRWKMAFNAHADQ